MFNYRTNSNRPPRKQYQTPEGGSVREELTMIAKPRPSAANVPSPRTGAPRAHHFRGSLGRFATGVAIVTFDGVTKRHGITVNSFTSVSMEPPLVLVSIARSTKAHDELAGRSFTVNILGAEQQQLAMHFAGRFSREPDWV